MNLAKTLFQIILTAVSYYWFSNEFFKFSSDIKKVKTSPAARFTTFLIVFIWFVLASLLELPLVINWFIFLIILGLEVHFIFHYDLLTSYAVSLFCVITGLAVNVFFRSFISILLDVPLLVFDKSRSSIKTIPILLGFLVMSLLLFALRRFHFTQKLEKMLQNRESLVFYARTELYIYLFLMFQLLVFTQSDNTIGIKTWGIKSALFSILIMIIAIIYSLRVASLHFYMEKRHEMRKHLIQEKKDVNKLWTLAFTDILTGCGNRQLLDKRLEEYANYGGSITLAFIDVNSLKTVNDQYGHLEGDHYLVCVSQALTEVIKGASVDLFRYGGDEFVMMSNTLEEKAIIKRLQQANEILDSDAQIPYHRSVSYGVVRGECADYRSLLAQADQIMYQFKSNHYRHLSRL